MPSFQRRAGTRLDIPGAIVLFAGLLCLIGPLLFGHDLHWSPLTWLAMAAGVGIVAAFLRLERAVARRGGMPLIDLSLLTDKAFMRGLAAVFFFFFANLSFYLVMTIYMQKGLQIPPLQAGLVFLPLALTFMTASRHSGMRAKHRGTLVLIEGCVVQIAGLAALVMAIEWIDAPSAMPLALVLAIFERRALDREARERRRSLRHLWHDGADCERRRRRGDRRSVLRDRIESVEPAGAACRIGAVYAVDYRLRRIPDMDASGHGMTN